MKIIEAIEVPEELTHLKNEEIEIQPLAIFGAGYRSITCDGLAGAYHE